MADKAIPASSAAARYVHGELVDRDPEALARDARSRERTGVTQVERVMQGEEGPADAVRERAELLRQLGPFAPRRGPGKELRVPPGSVVGKPTVDTRAVDKVTGRARFSADVYPPGVLFTRVLRSPYPHARVKRLDVSKAEAYPGVSALLTYEEVAAATKATRRALTGEPAFVGDPIAAVAAETDAIAEEAVRLIEVEYEQLSFVLDPREALKQGAPRVRSGLASNAVRDPQWSYERGKVEQGFAEADLTVEIDVETSFEQHVALEQHNATAVWDGDQLTLWSGSQWPHGVANTVANELGMPQSKVRVLAQDMGGGWGDKTGRHGYHVVTALLAKKTGRPVRWELNRKDIFLEMGHQYPLFAHARLGLKRNGTITALEGTTYVPAGAYGSPGNNDDWEAAVRTYKIPNVRVNGFTALTNTVVTSPQRGVGEPSGNFFTENLINKAAEALGMDPLEFRLRNIETETDQVTGLPYSSCALREALERGAELFGWSKRWQGWKKQWDRQGPQRGIGVMALTMNKGAGSPPMAAVVQIEADGSIAINSGAADIGGGQRTQWSMIVAEAIGVPLKTVFINSMDNRAGPNSGGIFGSRATKSVGAPMLQAALDARRKLIQGVAAKWKLTGASIDDIDIKDGLVYRKSDPANKQFQMTIAEAASSGVVMIDDIPRPAAGTIVGEARIPPFTGYAQKTFAAGFYEVEVDPGTGALRVTEAVQVHDVGRAINPTGVTNQIHGGILQGINKGLTDELIYDAPTGAVVNPNLDEYKLHMLDATPLKIQTDFVEPYDVFGPYGAKGVGEPACVPAMPTIHAAIYDAIGVRLNRLPMSTVAILEALRTQTT